VQTHQKWEEGIPNAERPTLNVQRPTPNAQHPTPNMWGSRPARPGRARPDIEQWSQSVAPTSSRSGLVVNTPRQHLHRIRDSAQVSEVHRGASRIRQCTPRGPYRRPMSRVAGGF